MENSIPYEVIGAPLTLWVAPVGTEFPAVDVEPAAPWVLVGKSGNKSYIKEGLMVDKPATYSKFRPAGSTAPIKNWRTEEDTILRVTLADLTPEAWSLAANGNAVETTEPSAGVPGTKKVGLYCGPEVAAYALIARGPSAEMADGVQQYQIPRVQQTGSQSISFAIGEPSGLALEFTAIYDSDADAPMGEVVDQTDDATT
jgi:hypothetical protein